MIAVLVAYNLVPVAHNVVPGVHIESNNVVQEGCLSAVLANYDCGPLQLPLIS